MTNTTIAQSVPPVRSFSPLRAVKNEFAELWKYRFVVYSYVYTTTKIRYKRSYFGYVWTVVGPMLHYIMIGFIMGLLLRNRMDNYYGHYFSGAVFFSMVAGVLSKAPNVMINNEHYIRKIYIPKAIFLLNVVTYEFVNFSLSAVSLLVLGILTNTIAFHAAFPISILALVLTAAFLLGIAGCLSVLTVYFRDFGHIIPVLLQALFFLTPIAYTAEMLPQEYRWMTWANPIYYFLELFRIPLVSGDIPEMKFFMIPFCLAFVSIAAGFWVLKKFDNKIVFKL